MPMFWPIDSRRPAGVCALAALLGLLLLLVSSSLRPEGQAPALLADVAGPIGPATSRFVDTVLGEASSRGAAMVILRMDTPGGLSDSMRDIIKAILRSPVPVAVFVAPSGARAASAGTYIMYASHVAAMAPGTNLGAATPVQIGDGLPLPGGDRPKKPDGKDDDAEPARDEPAGDAMKRKLVNDAIAYIRGLADLRGRNADWAERAVREAASLPSREALDEGVIDLVAHDVPALLAAMDGRSVEVLGVDTVLRTAGIPIELIEPSWQMKLLAIITNPNVALILMMIGIYGLIFEFANPGSIGPGVVGVICLLLALYALNMLPLDYAGLGLLLVGVAFMVAEAVTPSFGVLGVGGLIAFMLGASILIDSDSPAFRVSWYVIAGMGLVSAAMLAVVLGYALRVQRYAVTTGTVELTGEPATVIEWAAGEGVVRARGERWRARGEGRIEAGDRVDVRSVEGLLLHVSPRARNGTGEPT